MSEMSSTMLNEQLAAKRLGVSPALLRKLRQKGGGPPFARLARCIRYKVADLDAWVQTRTVSVGGAREGAAGRGERAETREAP